LEEVVVLALSLGPGAASVGADLEALHGLVRVDDLHREPVLGGALLVAKGERRGDGALDELVRSGDDAIASVSKLGEGVDEQIQVALITFGALVDNLGFKQGQFLKTQYPNSSKGTERPYHGSDGVAVRASDLHTRTAGSRAIPDLSRISSAPDTRGQGVGVERTSTAVQVSAIVSRFASVNSAIKGH
jgi:hypothetical protein